MLDSAGVDLSPLGLATLARTPLGVGGLIFLAGVWFWARFGTRRGWLPTPTAPRAPAANAAQGRQPHIHQLADQPAEAKTQVGPAEMGRARPHSAAMAWQRPLLQSISVTDPSGNADVCKESNRTARELHDAVSQTLFASNLLAGALALQPHADDTVRGQAQVLERLSRCALADLRMMQFELHPEVLHSVRLPELLQLTVEALVGRGGVVASTEIDDTLPLDTAHRINVYRIAQAALSNIARHSGAGHVRLHWQAPLDGPAQLRISDDGCGFDAKAATAAETAIEATAATAATACPSPSGLARIRQCADHLGAALRINSAPGQGTEIVLTLNRKETFT